MQDRSWRDLQIQMYLLTSVLSALPVMRKKKVQNHSEYFHRSGYPFHVSVHTLSFQMPTLLPSDNSSIRHFYSESIHRDLSQWFQAFQSSKRRNLIFCLLCSLPLPMFPLSVHMGIHDLRYNLYVLRSGLLAPVQNKYGFPRLLRIIPEILRSIALSAFHYLHF